MYVRLPLLGAIYTHTDHITLSRFSIETTTHQLGTEYLICLGALRVCLTPWSVVRNEERQGVALG